MTPAEAGVSVRVSLPEQTNTACGTQCMDADAFSLQQDIALVHYTAGIMLIGPSEQEVNLLARHLHVGG